MTWERACLGLPTLAVPIVDNQQFNDQVIARFQLAERLTLSELAEPDRLLQALQRLEWQADDYRRRGWGWIGSPPGCCHNPIISCYLMVNSGNYAMMTNCCSP